MGTRLVLALLGVIFHLGISVYAVTRLKATLKSLHVISDIKYRFATTQVSMTYYNPHNSSVIADLHVNMPKNSFISNFSMEIDGNVTVGEVKEKSVAKQTFDRAVKLGQSAGYVGVKHRFTNIFDISVNVEPHKYIVYNLTYQELLTRQGYKYRHRIHLSNGGIIDNFLVEVFISEPQDIIDLVVPQIQDDKLTNVTNDGELDSAFIEYTSSKDVYIKYNPSRKQQANISKDGVVGLLKVEYDVDRKNNSNLVYAVDGYFVHFFTSDSLPSLPKNVIFILDVSGSMSGRKIVQLREAMLNIVDQLDPELDKFLIGKFNIRVSWMMGKFLTANEVNKQMSKEYIKRIHANGGTDINSALLQSIEKHKSVSSTSRKSIIIFLTDGQPTSGVTITKDIMRNVKEANEDISLFTLGFGEKCDSKFLREISNENGGFSRKIYVDSDSKLQIENLYKEISKILLKDITFVYLNDVANTSTTSFSSYFKGSELVVSGALLNQNQSTMNVNVSMTDDVGPNNEMLELEIYGGNLIIDDEHFQQNPNLTTIQSFSEITEKTYAYLTLKQLLKEDRTTQVRNDILELALKYNFVTALTSMVVTTTYTKEELFEEDIPSTTPPYAVAYPMPTSGLLLHAVAYPMPTLGLLGLPMPTYRYPTHRYPTPASYQTAAHTTTSPHTTAGAHTTTSPHTTAGAHTTTSPHTTTGPQTTTRLYTTTGLRLRPNRYPTPIVIKALRCQSNLCFYHHKQCSHQTEILLLGDDVSKIYIYGQMEKISDSNCLEYLNRVIIKKGHSVTGVYTTANVTKPERISLDPSFTMTVSTYTKSNSETYLSLNFDILTQFPQPKGILRYYVTDFPCSINLAQEKLNNSDLIFHKNNFGTASSSVDRC